MATSDRSLVVEIEKSFVGSPAIRASLDLNSRGSHVTILFGPSGVGKTTVLRCIAGLDKPTRGTITFEGRIWSDAGIGRSVPPQERHLGYLAQDYALFPHLTLRRNIEYGLHKIRARERSRRVEEVLHLFGLTGLADRHPGETSGGQQQRAALARALAPYPRLLLLDEPLSALDLPTRNQLRSELARLLRRLEIPVLVVTHDWTEALSLGDSMAVMGRDGILQTGPPHEVFTRPAHLEVAAAVGVETIVPCRLLERKEGILSLAAGPGRITAVDPAVEGDDFYACLRGEDVTLEKGDHTPSSARNHLAGTVREISPAGSMLRIAVDVGFTACALITRQAAADLELAAGTAVTVVFKASAVHLIPRAAADSDG